MMIENSRVVSSSRLARNSVHSVDISAVMYGLILDMVARIKSTLTSFMVIFESASTARRRGDRRDASGQESRASLDGQMAQWIRPCANSSMTSSSWWSRLSWADRLAMVTSVFSRRSATQSHQHSELLVSQSPALVVLVFVEGSL